MYKSIVINAQSTNEVSIVKSKINHTWFGKYSTGILGITIVEVKIVGSALWSHFRDPNKLLHNEETFSAMFDWLDLG